MGILFDGQEFDSVEAIVESNLNPDTKPQVQIIEAFSTPSQKVCAVKQIVVDQLKFSVCLVDLEQVTQANLEWIE